MQIPVGAIWCLLKQRMFSIMIILAVIGYASLHTEESSASDIIDDGQKDVQINILRTDFHAATIKIWLPDSNKWIDILCDLGAAISIMNSSTLGRAATRARRLTKQFSRLIATNGAFIGRVLGRTRVKMQFCKSGPTIEHDVSVVDSSVVPDLLGVDFLRNMARRYHLPPNHSHCSWMVSRLKCRSQLKAAVLTRAQRQYQICNWTAKRESRRGRE